MENINNDTELFNSIHQALNKNDVESLNSLMIEQPQTEAAPEAPKEEAKPVVEDEKSKSESTDAAPPATPPENQDGKQEKPSNEAKEQKTTEDFSWVEAAPAELKDKIEALINQRNEQYRARKLAQQQYNSYVGRLGAYQRTITDLNAKLAKVSSRPLQHDISAAKLETDEDFKTLAENDPKFAAFLKKREEERERALAEAFDKRINEFVAPIVQAKEQEYLDSQKMLLRELVPNVDDVVKTPEFGSWFREQTPEVQSMLTSNNALSAFRGLQMYRDDMLARYHYEEPQEAPAQRQHPQAPSVNAAEQEEAKKLIEQRARKTSPSTQASSTKQPIGNIRDEVVDPEDLFRSFYKKIHPSSLNK